MDKVAIKEKLRIGINLFILDFSGSAGGTLNYIVGLLQALEKIDQKNNYLILCQSSMKAYFKNNFAHFEVADVPQHDVDTFIRFTYLGKKPESKSLDWFYRVRRWFRILKTNQIVFKDLIRIILSKFKKQIPTSTSTEMLTDFASVQELFQKWKPDVWFCPVMEISPFNGQCAMVVSIPDLQHIAYPEFFPLRHITRRQFVYPISCAYADVVVTVSKYSRRTFIENFNLPSEKVISIYHGVSFLETSQDAKAEENILKKYSIQKPYLFYPANLWPHKNHLRLVAAFELLHQKKINIQLVLTGYSSSSEIEKILQDKARKYHWLKYLGYIPRQDVEVLLKDASAMVFPSLYEGFGIPIVEAMHKKIPVIASNVCSIPEILGNHAFYFNPLDEKNMADIIEKAFNQPEQLKQSVQSNFIKAQEFTYENAAYQFLEVWPKAVEQYQQKSQKPILQGISLDGSCSGYVSFFFHAPALRQIDIQGVFLQSNHSNIKVYLDKNIIWDHTCTSQKSFHFDISDFGNYHGNSIHHFEIKSENAFKLSKLIFNDQKLGALDYLSLT